MGRDPSLCRFRLITFNLSNLCFSGSPPPPRSRFNTAPAPPLLVVLDAQHPMYKDQGIDFQSLAHLEGLGLIKVLPQGYTIGPGKAAYVLDGTSLVLSCDRPIQMGVAYFTTGRITIVGTVFPPGVTKGFRGLPGRNLAKPWSLSHKSPSLIYAKTVMTISDFNTMHWCVIQLKISLFPRKRESTEGGLGRRLTSETGSMESQLVMTLTK